MADERSASRVPGPNRGGAAPERSLGDLETGIDSGATASDLDAAVRDLSDLGLELVDLQSRYEIREPLGRGGMGEVLKAIDRRLMRPVAIKRVRGDLAQNPQALARFLTEARAVAALGHFNIVQVFDYGRSAEGPFLVMEFVDGQSLAHRLEQGPLSLDEAVDLTCRLCDALAHAHAQGIIHRDIKPANILLTKDNLPKLSDFGLARRQGASAQHTQSGAVLGTLDFMPPEQRTDASRADARSDQWSLAATLYQMLTGDVPRVIDPEGVPEPVRPVLLKALRSKPAERYESIAAFKDALRASTSRTGVVSAAELKDGECPRCHALNDTARKFCKACGGALQDPCPACGKPAVAWERYCGECGADVTAVVESQIKTADEVRDDVESLRTSYDYAAAIARLEPLLHATHSALKPHRQWAEGLRTTLQEELAQAESRREQLVKAAREQSAQGQDSAAEKLLTQVPAPLHTDQTRALAAAIAARVQQARTLASEIQTAVRAKNYAGLDETLRQYLELRPRDEQARRLQTKLEERNRKRPKPVAIATPEVPAIDASARGETERRTVPARGLPKKTVWIAGAAVAGVLIVGIVLALLGGRGSRSPEAEKAAKERRVAADAEWEQIRDVDPGQTLGKKIKEAGALRTAALQAFEAGRFTEAGEQFQSFLSKAADVQKLDAGRTAAAKVRDQMPESDPLSIDPQAAGLDRANLDAQCQAAKRETDRAESLFESGKFAEAEAAWKSAAVKLRELAEIRAADRARLEFKLVVQPDEQMLAKYGGRKWKILSEEFAAAQADRKLAVVVEEFRASGRVAGAVTEAENAFLDSAIARVTGKDPQPVAPVLAEIDQLLKRKPSHARAKSVRGQLEVYDPAWWVAKVETFVEPAVEQYRNSPASEPMFTDAANKEAVRKHLVELYRGRAKTQVEKARAVSVDLQAGLAGIERASESETGRLTRDRARRDVAALLAARGRPDQALIAAQGIRDLFDDGRALLPVVVQQLASGQGDEARKTALGLNHAGASCEGLFLCIRSAIQKKRDDDAKQLVKDIQSRLGTPREKDDGAAIGLGWLAAARHLVRDPQAVKDLAEARRLAGTVVDIRRSEAERRIAVAQVWCGNTAQAQIMSEQNGRTEVLQAIVERHLADRDWTEARKALNDLSGADRAWSRSRIGVALAEDGQIDAARSELTGLTESTQRVNLLQAIARAQVRTGHVAEVVPWVSQTTSPQEALAICCGAAEGFHSTPPPLRRRNETVGRRAWKSSRPAALQLTTNERNHSQISNLKSQI